MSDATGVREEIRVTRNVLNVETGNDSILVKVWNETWLHLQHMSESGIEFRKNLITFSAYI